MITRPGRAHLVWAAAVAVYVVAVLHRGSFGVAGVVATERFGVGAAVLSTFVVVQLAVYAALQVPVGLLLDRVGSRAMISGGALLMAAGQVLIAFADHVALALVARVLIGAGDAATFISVLRLVTHWFPARQVPVITQVTGLIGQLGQLAATVPLVAALHRGGWTVVFAGLGALGVAASAMGWALIRDRDQVGSASLGPVGAQIRAVAVVPGTWLGFWSHWVGQFPMTVTLLIWGYPFLTLAQGLPPATAGALLSGCVLAAMAGGPVLGVLTARHPLRRSWLVLGVTSAVAVAWSAVLVRSGPSPLWLLVALVVAMGIGGPASVIGFDYARTFNSPARVGTATGLVNVGGFAASVLTVLAIGLVLDLRAPIDGALSLAAFRWGFSVMAPVWLVGVAGVLVSRRRTRAAMRGRTEVPPLRAALAARRAARG